MTHWQRIKLFALSMLISIGLVAPFAAMFLYF